MLAPGLLLVFMGLREGDLALLCAVPLGGAYLLAMSLVVIGWWSQYDDRRRTYAQNGYLSVGKGPEIIRYHYYCNICGYRWKWDEGEPWPEVKVRPDLIVKGEQRLEEEAAAAEEEERKRKERDFIMLSQRYRKK